MKKNALSLAFVLALCLAFLAGLFVVGPALTPGADAVSACDVEFVCNFEASPQYCCFVDCYGNIVGPCIYEF